MMFITKFNKLIRNKLVWAVLLVFIVLVFIDWASARSDRASLFDVVITSIARIFNPEHGRLADAAASFDGRPISKQEYAEAMAHAQLSLALMVGRGIDMNSRLRPMLERMAWKRILTLKQAHAMGLKATDLEIEHAMLGNPAFQENGRFSQNRFQGFITEFLPTLMQRNEYGARTLHDQFDMFRKVIAEELEMNRMRGVLAGAAWVAPLETAQTFRQLHDVFLASYFVVTPADLPETPAVSPADARLYYEAHSNDFRVATQRKVRYVAFPIEDHLDVGGVTEDTIENFYYSNMERFTHNDSNGVPVTIPLDYTADEIRMQIAAEDAAQATMEYARDFLDCLEPEGDAPAPDFSAVATASSLTVRTTEFFTARSTPTDVPGADDDFAKAAFALGDVADGSASYPVQGKDSFYILSLYAEKEAYIPSFEEIAPKATRLAQAEAEAMAMHDFIGSLRTNAERQLAKGRTFDEIAADADFPIQTTEPFTITSGMEVESDLFQTLMRHVILCNTGEMTEPVPVHEGVMLAYVDSRQLGDQTTFDAIRFDLVKYMQQRKAEALFAQWQESLIATNRFVSLLPKTGHEQYNDDYSENSENEDNF